MQFKQKQYLHCNTFYVRLRISIESSNDLIIKLHPYDYDLQKIKINFQIFDILHNTYVRDLRMKLFLSVFKFRF